LSVGLTSQLSATASLANGTAQTVTRNATWQSSNAAVATVSAGGLVTAVVPGTARITATYQGSVGSFGVLVPPTVASLAVSGVTLLTALGSASQLTATVSLDGGSTQNVTAGAAWQTSSAAVVTVSTSGLITAVSAGAATITATYEGHTASTTVSIAPSAPVAVSSCQAITTPGVYSLTADISGAAPQCIRIQAPNVDLECNGHAVADSGTAIAILNPASNVTVNNCAATTTTQFGVGIDVESAHAVTISNSTSASPHYRGVFVNRSSNVSVSNSAISGAWGAILVEASQYTQVLNNQLSIIPSPSASVVLLSGGGSHNTFSQNQISGAPAQATDDGILVNTEDSDLIEGNTMVNFYDAGFESVGPLTNTTIVGNTIRNAGTAGIGVYWSTFWSGNTVARNHISQSGQAINIAYDGILPPGEPQTPLATTITFQNNTFSANIVDATVHEPVLITFAGRGGNTANPLPQPLVASNNVFLDNVLPVNARGPTLLPTSAFVDGGGNVCGAGGTLLACASVATSTSVSLRREPQRQRSPSPLEAQDARTVARCQADREPLGRDTTCARSLNHPRETS
jgi:Right handed beta helix region/Bacterial Ig-like domain (group 2)